MSAKEDRREVVADALHQTRELPCPDGMDPIHWLGLRAVLIELCLFLPNVFPGQGKLATKLFGATKDKKLRKNRVRSVQRLLAEAEDLKLIARTLVRTSDDSRWEHTEYRLLWLDTPLSPPVAAGGPVTLTGPRTPVGGPVKVTGGPVTMTGGVPSPCREGPVTVTGGSRQGVVQSSLLRREEKFPPPEGNNDSSNDPAAAAAAAADPRTWKKPNRDPGDCVVCSAWVAAGVGTTQAGTNPWLEPVHWECFGQEPGSVLSGQAAADAAAAQAIKEHVRAFDAERDAAVAAGLPTAAIYERYGVVQPREVFDTQPRDHGSARGAASGEAPSSAPGDSSSALAGPGSTGEPEGAIQDSPTYETLISLSVLQLREVAAERDVEVPPRTPMPEIMKLILGDDYERQKDEHDQRQEQAEDDDDDEPVPLLDRPLYTS